MRSCERRGGLDGSSIAWAAVMRARAVRPRDSQPQPRNVCMQGKSGKRSVTQSLIRGSSGSGGQLGQNEKARPPEEWLGYMWEGRKNRMITRGTTRTCNWRVIVSRRVGCGGFGRECERVRAVAEPVEVACNTAGFEQGAGIARRNMTTPASEANAGRWTIR